MTDKDSNTYKLTKEELYLNQVELLDTFLKNGAITQAQYNKSYRDLTEKMGMSHLSKENKQ